MNDIFRSSISDTCDRLFDRKNRKTNAQNLYESGRAAIRITEDGEAYYDTGDAHTPVGGTIRWEA